MPILRLLLSSLLSVSLAMGTASISTNAAAAGSAAVSLGAMSWRVADEPAAVLTLDGEDAAAADALSAALRRALAKRGLSGSQDMSLVELRLTMGCDNDEPSCLAEGGKTLGVRRLVYGYLRPTASGFLVEVRILEVDRGVVDREASVPVTKAEMRSANIDDTAQKIVNTLLPGEDASDPIPPRTTSTPDEPSEPLPPPEDRPKRERDVWFGLEKPTPKWKWAGFGVSLGLAIASGVTWAVLGRQLSKEQDNLNRAADESLLDDKISNNVDRGQPGIDLCDAARREPPGEPGTVTNARMAKICNRADGMVAGSWVAGAGTIAFGLSTLVFTGLLFIHRNKPGAQAFQRHGVTVGAGPTPDGGMTVSGRVRF